MGLLDPFTPFSKRSIFDQIQPHVHPYTVALKSDQSDIFPTSRHARIRKTMVKKFFYGPHARDNCINPNENSGSYYCTPEEKVVVPLVVETKVSSDETEKVNSGKTENGKENGTQNYGSGDQIANDFLLTFNVQQGDKTAASHYPIETTFSKKPDIFHALTLTPNVLRPKQLEHNHFTKDLSGKEKKRSQTSFTGPLTERTENTTEEDQETFRLERRKRKRSTEGSDTNCDKTSKKSECKRHCKCSPKKHQILANIFIGRRRESSGSDSGHAWIWLGEPFRKNVFLNNDDPLVERTCYPAIRHTKTGLTIRERDCVLLRVGDGDEDLPSVAKVASFWEDPKSGEMMMSLLWYYRPQDVEQDGHHKSSPNEVYASRHADHSSVDCIEDKCYVLPYGEYCRYQRKARAYEEGVIEDASKVPLLPNLRRPQEVPLNADPDLVMFCERVYNVRLRRLMKPPEKVSLVRNQR